MSKLKTLKKTATASDHGQMYGTTTVGARGQIVIPAKAREDFGLRAGSQLFIVGKSQTGMLGLVRAENLSEFVDKLMKHLTKVGADRNLKSRVRKLLTQATKD